MTTNLPRLQCRLLVLQPALPWYRQPFFRELGARVTSLAVMHGVAPIPGGVGPVPATEEHTRAIPVGHRRIGPALWMPALWRAAGSRKHDVVVFSWNSRYLHLPGALLRARHAGRGVVLWGHGYSPHESGARRTYRNLLARSANAVVTYNRRAARDVIEAGVSAAKVFVAPNALDQSAIDSTATTWAAKPDALRRFRTDLEIDGHPVALYVSRLSNAGTLRLLAETWQHVARRMPGARLVVVGDGPARNAFMAAIAQCGVAGSVRCVGAIFGEYALAPYFLSARVLLHPVKIGLSLNHAMGYGVPVATFDDAARHSPEFEALRDGVNGVLAPLNDASALAARTAEVLLDPGLAERLGRAARDTMRSSYRLETMVDGFLQAVGRAHMWTRRGTPARALHDTAPAS